VVLAFLGRRARAWRRSDTDRYMVRDGVCEAFCTNICDRPSWARRCDRELGRSDPCPVA